MGEVAHNGKGWKKKVVVGGVGRRMGENGRCWDLKSEDLSLNLDSPVLTI